MSERYDLTKIGPVLSLEPVVIQMTDYPDFSTFYTGAVVQIDHSKPHPFMSDRRTVFQYARHIPRKTTRQMTAQEIAYLPKGTAFIDDDGTTYNPTITLADSGDIEINGSDVCNCTGYILPNESLIRPFTTEDVAE